MNTDVSLWWGVVSVVVAGLGKSVYEKLDSYVGENVGEGLEYEVWDEFVSIKMSNMKLIWILIIVLICYNYRSVGAEVLRGNIGMLYSDIFHEFGRSNVDGFELEVGN